MEQDYSLVTEQYKFLDNITQGDIRQNNTGVYLDETLESGKWLFQYRLKAGLF